MTPDHRARLLETARIGGVALGTIEDIGGGARANALIRGVEKAVLTVGASQTSAVLTLVGTPAQLGAVLARLNQERAIA
jgi:hypothetical protein